MIDIKNIRELRYQDYDAAWAIVRSMKSKSRNIVQVADLSPSTNLFWQYRNMVQNGVWGRQAFELSYVPQFITEVKHNPDATRLLAWLFELDRQGKKIALACFCSDETLCHRSIVAGILQGAGCDVRAAHDYTKYWEIYKAA